MFYVDGVCQLDIVDLSMVDEGPPCGDVRWRRRGRRHLACAGGLFEILVIIGYLNFTQIL